MKVVLISPAFFVSGRLAQLQKRLQRMGVHGGDSPPLGLAYVGAGAQAHGHRVRICDMRVEQMEPEAFAGRFREFAPDLFGIYLTTINIREAVECARFIKTRYPNAICVAGGPHVGVYPRETLELGFFDYAFMGEADETFPAFLDALAEKRLREEDIQGLVYRDSSGQIQVTGGPAIVFDINRLPMAAHHLFEGSYRYFATVREPYTSMITSRGCPFNCRFCGKIPGTRKVRLRTAEKVLAEMLHATSLGYREIYFYDDLFTVSRQRVFDLCDGIRRRGLDLPWSVRARVDSVDEELLARMKAAGCRRLYFGVESGSAHTLELMDKRITTEQALRAVQLCRRIGLETVSYFILGFPGETEADMTETIRFACELPTDFASFNIFCPLPASPVHDLLCSQGTDPWLDYIHLRSDQLPSFHGDLDAATVERYFRECWKKFYGRPRAWAALGRMIDSPHRAKSFALAAFSVAISKVLTSRLEVRS